MRQYESREREKKTKRKKKRDKSEREQNTHHLDPGDRQTQVNATASYTRPEYIYKRATNRWKSEERQLQQSCLTGSKIPGYVTVQHNCRKAPGVGGNF